ncbi:hypothetical protein Taro_043092 [Colocasia esculenta]|uniref:Uncharacterized protein n=1 Tax=Colocasia esculenta TaxID=4460 RepID=A0A843WIJ0_COLES|nr:hypothetical protein [Colocasia esculenta]
MDQFFDIYKQLLQNSDAVQEDFLKWFRRYIQELKAANDPRCADDIEVLSQTPSRLAYSHSGYIWLEATETAHYLAAECPHTLQPIVICVASTVGSTSSIAGPVSSQAWVRGHGRWGPSRGVTDRRLETGQQWNWDRTAHTDKEMLMHMSSMHRTWRGVLKKRNIADRNKTNRSHQSMPYRKGRKSHYQLKDDFERMIQLLTPSLDSDSGSTPISTKRLLFQLWGRSDLVAFVTEAVGRHSALGMGQEKG